MLDTHFLLSVQNHIEFFFFGNSVIAEIDGSIQTFNYYTALCPGNENLPGWVIKICRRHLIDMPCVHFRW